LGVFTLALAILIWVKDNRRWLRWFGVIAVFGVVVQAVLGGQVVRQLLQYWLPVMHAVFAQIVFAACWESRCLRANGGYRSVHNWRTAARLLSRPWQS